MNELKPCPFCGGPAERYVFDDVLTVGCGNCSIHFCNHVRFGCQADAGWNSRADSALVERLEKLVSRIENFGAYESKHLRRIIDEHKEGCRGNAKVCY